MVCAIAGAERGRKVCIIEKNPAVGKKIYATGNGRCNITNSNCENANYVLAFFRSLGLETVTEEEGRVYPASSQAADVVFVLEKRLKKLGVDIICGRQADWVESSDKEGSLGFSVYCERERFDCSSLVLACGGKAAPKFGTTGDGYALARQLGHSISKPLPVLTAIETMEPLSHLKGVRAAADCSLIRKGETVFREMGEVQFAEYGLSGICIFNMSRHLLLDEDTGFQDYNVSLDFTAPYGYLNGKNAEELIEERCGIPGFRKKDILRTMLPQALAADISGRAGLAPDEPAGSMTDSEIREVCQVMRSWKQQVKGAKGWQMAQCTKGGVSIEEIDMSTMESRVCPGLYVTGELLDIDGPCGGYNLQNAWETGIRAGKNV